MSTNTKPIPKSKFQVGDFVVFGENLEGMGIVIETLYKPEWDDNFNTDPYSYNVKIIYNPFIGDKRYSTKQLGRNLPYYTLTDLSLRKKER